MTLPAGVPESVNLLLVCAVDAGGALEVLVVEGGVVEDDGEPLEVLVVEGGVVEDAGEPLEVLVVDEDAVGALEVLVDVEDAGEPLEVLVGASDVEETLEVPSVPPPQATNWEVASSSTAQRMAVFTCRIF
jgi:hypothetical protein